MLENHTTAISSISDCNARNVVETLQIHCPPGGGRTQRVGTSIGATHGSFKMTINGSKTQTLTCHFKLPFYQDNFPK